MGWIGSDPEYIHSSSQSIGEEQEEIPKSCQTIRGPIPGQPIRGRQRGDPTTYPKPSLGSLFHHLGATLTSLQSVSPSCSLRHCELPSERHGWGQCESDGRHHWPIKVLGFLPPPAAWQRKVELKPLWGRLSLEGQGRPTILADIWVYLRIYCMWQLHWRSFFGTIIISFSNTR